MLAGEAKALGGLISVTKERYTCQIEICDMVGNVINKEHKSVHLM